jgi:integrase
MVHTSQNKESGESMLLLSELIETYCAALQKEKPANEGTQSRYRDALDTMLRLLGDKEITGYTRQDLLVLKTKLYRWPANINKSGEFRNKTAEEILRMKPAKTLDKLTVDTRYMDKIAAVFQYAFHRDLIAVDISQNVVKTVTVAEKKASKRKPYDIEDLKKIFASLPVHQERPHLAWVPLIAAWSGARQGEICGLRVSDIDVYHRIPYMIITEEDDNGNIVKNVRGEASRRLVPLHPILVEMGLLQFVAMRKAQGKELLFELRPKGSDESVPLTGEYYGQSFEIFNRKHVTHDLRKSFQSFRYNVHHALALKSIPPELCFAITGHVPQYESEQITPGDKRLEDKYKALVQLVYPGVELAALKEKLGSLLG